MLKAAIFRIVLVLCSVFLSYQIVYAVAERYFFDKFFYYKSVAHGYWVPEIHPDIRDFGARSKDVRPLFEYASRKAAASEADTYTIAVIGDSYVWGQGLRFERTLPRLLERKLSRVRKTRVLSLATSGDDMIENYSKYLYAKSLGADVFVFVLVNNDLLLNLQRKYSGTDDERTYEQLTALCERQTGEKAVGVMWADWDVHGSEYYERMMAKSYESPVNTCILNKIATDLPKDNAIYFIPADHDYYLDKYVDTLMGHGNYLLDAWEGKTMRKYRHGFRDMKRYFRLSQKEDHPSALAHEMYADVLARELLKNPVWKFTSSPERHE